MKKALFTCFTGLVLTWSITSSYSQNSNSNANALSRPSIEGFISSSEEINALKDSVTVFLNEISTRAVRNFTREYKNIPDAKWFKYENGFAVYFTSDSIQKRIFYNKRGDRTCVIRDYCEDRLPREIRHLVKSTYYDFDIYLINEVTMNGITAYVVKIQDKTSMKEIKVVGGVVEVMKEYIKAEQ